LRVVWPACMWVVGRACMWVGGRAGGYSQACKQPVKVCCMSDSNGVVFCREDSDKGRRVVSAATQASNPCVPLPGCAICWAGYCAQREKLTGSWGLVDGALCTACLFALGLARPGWGGFTDVGPWGALMSASTIKYTGLAGQLDMISNRRCQRMSCPLAANVPLSRNTSSSINGGALLVQSFSQTCEMRCRALKCTLAGG
jgi:hypothetical protein